MQIIDRKTIAIPGQRGPMGDVTPAALAVLADAQAARDAAQTARTGAQTARTGAETARDQAQTYAAGTVALQDAAMTGILGNDTTAFAQLLESMTALQSVLLRSGDYMDVWPAVPVPASYGAWVTAIDAGLAGAGVKRTIGQDSYGMDVHLYEAGTGTRRMLLISGQHPFEFVGQASSAQWFIQFATSRHPVFIALRRTLKVFLIPTVMPGGFLVRRENANNVNINRNYPINHANSSDAYKGPSPLSEPESMIVKTVIDTYKPSLIFDCHNYGSSGQSDIAFGSSRIVHAKAAVVYKATEMWKRANADGLTETLARLDDSNRDPTLVNWASKYLRFNRGDSTAMVMLIECLSTLAGSTASNVTRRAVRLYASMIHQGVLSWLESGQQDESPREAGTHGHFSVDTGFDVAIADGGRKVSNTAWEAVLMPTTSSSSTLKMVETPLTYPGRVQVKATVNLVRSGTNADKVRVDIGLSFTNRQGTPATGPVGSTVRSLTMVAGDVGSISTEYESSLISEVPDENIFAAQLWIRVSADQNVRISSPNMTTGSGGGARLMATTKPSFEPFIRPFNGF